MKIKNKIWIGISILIGYNVLTLKSSFNKKNVLLTISIDVAMIAVLLFIHFFYKQKGKNKKIIHWILWLLTVPFIFWMVQIIAVEQFVIKGKYLVFNLILYLILWIILTLLFRKVKTGAVIYGILFLLLALADYYVTLFRGQPFMLIDLLNIKTAVTVASTYQFEISQKIGLCLYLFWFFIMLQILFQNMEYQKKKVNIQILRIIALTTCLAGSAVVFGFLKKSNAIEAVDLWDTQSDYVNKGLVYTLMAEGQYLTAEKPKEYKKEQVVKIVEKLEAEYNEEILKKEQIEITPENIIVIMNESWADLELINEIKSDNDFMPYVKSLREKFSNGYIHVPVFGAGTAETEYEMLTGNLKYFLPTGSVAYKLYAKEPEYGLAYALKEQGYQTVAVHPYFGENWNRKSVYEKMRFDDFISMENWNAPMDALRTFASDSSTYDRILRLYENKKQGEKLFTFCVTMQNHGGYDTDSAGDFINTVSLNYESEYPLAETYLSEVNVTDAALKKLIDYFEDSNENTMIVMFGDHLPAIEKEFYEELFGKKIEDLTIEELQKRYMTPYIMWTNYACERKVEDISSNYLGSYILECAGLKMTSYEKSILALKTRLPVIGQGAVYTENGMWYSIDANLPEKYMETLNDYQMLQYNNIFDKVNLVSDMQE